MIYSVSDKKLSSLDGSIARFFSSSLGNAVQVRAQVLHELVHVGLVLGIFSARWVDTRAIQSFVEGPTETRKAARKCCTAAFSSLQRQQQRQRARAATHVEREGETRATRRETKLDVGDMPSTLLLTVLVNDRCSQAGPLLLASNAFSC